MISRYEPLPPAVFHNQIAIVTAAGVLHHVPLLQAAAAGRIDLVFLLRTGPIVLPGWSTKPAVVVVSDDDDASTGPAGWRDVRRLRAWHRGLLVHGTGGLAEHYEATLVAAGVCRRLLIVDTASAEAPAWRSSLVTPGTCSLMRVPHDGLSHPLPPQTVH